MNREEAMKIIEKLLDEVTVSYLEDGPTVNQIHIRGGSKKCGLMQIVASPNRTLMY